MWTKANDLAIYVDAKRGSSELYDEVALRRTLREFLSDESRARFGGNNFMQDEDYLKSIEHLVSGLRLFYK
ncbi:MAG: hypothetical protein EKK57_05000 [Proteobacteria bacterium]|nr:MAG: hypothetical protein EKK57_05000 [Pseudomonadota bacterium]